MMEKDRQTDRQIEQARAKPLTAENLNYIGDLYMKKGDSQRAVLYFFEAADKLHYAQKDKKLAIYKKIIKISPLAEKAYIGIIEILSNMGLVIEEKKYLHLLGKIYEEMGERDKADRLLDKVRELDPHVSIPGSFFRAPNAAEPSGEGPVAIPAGLPAEPGEAEESTRQNDEPAQAAPEIEEESRDKLIEASIEEFAEIEPAPKVFVRPATRATKRTVRPSIYLLVAVPAIVLAIIAVLFVVMGRSRKEGGAVLPLPVTAVRGDIEVTVSVIENPEELAGVLRREDINSRIVAAVSVKALKGCLPEAFASSPHTMISLLDARGTPLGAITMEGLQDTVKVIYKADVCGKEKSAVFARMVLPMEKGLSYSGLSLQGIEKSGAPLMITWRVP